MSQQKRWQLSRSAAEFYERDGEVDDEAGGASPRRCRVTHGASLATVQGQPACVATVTLPAPPVTSKAAVLAPKVYAHAPADAEIRSNR